MYRFAVLVNVFFTTTATCTYLETTAMAHRLAIAYRLSFRRRQTPI